MPTRVWSDASRAYRYGFNGKEKDFETASDNFDFGARIYDGRLGRWLSLDPFILKYPGIAPFCYVSNCPLLFYDPNGKEIIIHYKDENGNNKTYTYNYDPACTPIDNKFVQNVVNSLNAIYEGSELGREIISLLQSSDRLTHIVNSTITGVNRHLNGVKGWNPTGGEQPFYPEGYDGSYGDLNGSVVIWDDLTGGITNSIGCNIRPPASKLMHELIHSYIYALSNKLMFEYNNLSDEDKKGEKGQSLLLQMEKLSKYTIEVENGANEDALILDFENIINEQMGWGTRNEDKEKGITPHDGAETGEYTTNNPLSQNSSNSTSIHLLKTASQRNDKKN